MLTAPVAMVAQPAGAHDGNHPEKISRDLTFRGPDTYQFSIRMDASQNDHFNIGNGSFVRAQGYYVDKNGSGQPTQEAAGIRGIIQYTDSTTCENTNGDDFCFMDMAGVSKKDVSEARVHSGQLGGFTFEQDPNWWAWGSATGSIEFNGAQRFDVPPGADQLTIRIFISIPDVERLDVKVHLHSPQDIQIRDETAHDGGFAYAGDDFDPDTHVNTWGAQVMTDGQRQVTLPDGERLFAGFGPSWFGQTQTISGGVTHNTAAVSSLAFHHPDGHTTSGTAVAAFSGPMILAPGDDTPGEYGFEVRRHVGSGPQDVYLIGWKGDLV